MKLLDWNKDRVEEIVQLWNDELQTDFPMRKQLFIQNSFQDENVCADASKIAVDKQDNVIGFIVAKKWQETLDVAMSDTTGWIQALIVQRDQRQKGVGSALLRHAEKELIKSGVEQLLLGRDPWHYFPGIPVEYEYVSDWFERKGYEKQGVEHDLICTYEAGEVIDIPKRDGVEFSLLDKQDKKNFLSFLRRCFPGRWEYEAMHYFQKGGTGREFVVLKRAGQIVGFCRINDDKSPMVAQNVYWAPLFNEVLGGVGPLGIDAEERGQGFGLAIVEAGIAFLRKRDIKRIVIDWTGLVDFYKKLGYEVWKSYSTYTKIVK